MNFLDNFRLFLSAPLGLFYGAPLQQRLTGANTQAYRRFGQCDGGVKIALLRT